MVDGSPTLATASYHCGAVEIDAGLRRVLVAGAPAKLGARAFDVLLALVERRDRVVSKRELLDVVWPRLVVEENNLLVHMVALRKLLGSQAIATIPGRGYRFVLPVDTVVDAQGSEPGSRGARPPGSDAQAVVRGNLPGSVPLFGRTSDLDAVVTLLREHAVVTVVGAGGIGKTRIAIAAAAAAGSAWPDGRWWVELAPVTEGAQVPNCIATALGLQLASADSTPEALAEALAGRDLLLALDSCEHIADDVAALVDLLRARAPQAQLLLTSQESLKCRDEQVYRLGPLAVPDSEQLEEAAQFGAVALFVERAHAVDPRFRLAADNVAPVIDICRRLDGIPLAIELAAARVPLLGVQGLHARLHELFNVLSGGARMKLRRHQTLRAALEWSHGLLTADEQVTFRRLGVFAGGFTLELAQQVASDDQIDPWTVLDLLGRLIDKSLVIADGGAEPRYRLLETARAYALEMLAAAGESERTLRRHAEVMCRLMAAADANCWNLTPAERRRAVQELGNLRAALDWAMADRGDRRLAIELLSRCWLAWMHNSLIAEGVRRMRQLLPLPSDLPAKAEADFCLALSRLHEDAGRDEEWQAAQRAVTLYRQLGDAERLGDALLLTATIGFNRDQPEVSGAALREAETLVTEAMPLRKQAALAATQGTMYRLAGAREAAIAAFRRQAEAYRRAGAEIGVCLALGNVGAVQLDRDDLDGAIESLRAAVDGLRRLNSPFGRGHRLGTLAVALALRGVDGQTLAIAREAFEQLRSLGASYSPLMAAALHHARRGDGQRAAIVAGHARATRAQRLDSPCAFDRRLDREVTALMTAAHSQLALAGWLRIGENLAASEIAPIAFEGASLDLPQAPALREEERQRAH